jgi:hypothetical protein
LALIRLSLDPFTSLHDGAQAGARGRFRHWLIIGHRHTAARRQDFGNFLQEPGSLLHGENVKRPTKQNGTYWPNPVIPVKSTSAHRKEQTMTQAQRLLLETLAGHMALLQSAHPRKANTVCAKRARLYVRSMLRQSHGTSQRRLAA